MEENLEGYDPQQVIAALTESNDLLQEEVNRLRNSNRILRTVHRALRATLVSQRAQLELAHFNDDVFKRFCAGEFDAPNQFAEVKGELDESGLLEPGSQAERAV